MHVTLRHLRLAAWLLAPSFATLGRAQSEANTFVWGFQTINTTVVQECARLQIFVGPRSGAQPPYTFIAYEANGFPTVQTLGSDLGNLWWNVDHSAGSRLVMSMVDGAGNSGGVVEEVYTVAPGGSTACHPSSQTSPISITTNTTTTLNTCDVLTIKVTGGQKPYTITVAALNTTSAFNSSMGTYDQLNWINRAPPGSQFLVTANDATGKYAAATALIATTGSSDLSCNGRLSTFIDSTGITNPSQSGAPAATSTTPPGSRNQNKSSKRAIIGGLVGGVVILGALLVGLLFFLRKRRTRSHGPREYLDGDSHGGFGLNKTGNSEGRGGYDPVAQEITPFVMTGGQGAPYRDHNENSHTYGQHQGSTMHYNQSSYSTGAETLVDDPSHPDQHGLPTIVPPLPSGAAAQPQISTVAAAQPTSTSSFDPYDPYANMSVAPSTPTTEPPAFPGILRAGPGSVASGTASSAGPVAGGSGSTGLRLVGHASSETSRSSDVKGGETQVQRPQTVYQHEDVADVEELPPAYKERPT